MQIRLYLYHIIFGLYASLKLIQFKFRNVLLLKSLRARIPACVTETFGQNNLSDGSLSQSIASFTDDDDDAGKEPFESNSVK